MSGSETGGQDGVPPFPGVVVGRHLGHRHAELLPNRLGRLGERLRAAGVEREIDPFGGE